jgi:DNA (cytosine-5)-methyltransferase 1
MNYLSVCSGIEAATVAWHPLGWNPVGFGEIEKFPSQVLAHHYPNVPNLGDMTKFKEWQIESDVNVLVGGTPCQSFSVAGLRKGLDDPRGNLMLTYLAIAAKYRPKWLVWENVPGVLSSNGGHDFASLLRGMGELGYGFAYRVLDAQYFGVAQRRRRVFVVGYLGNWHRAAAVLFERHSLCGYPAPSREKGESVAPTIKASVGTGGVDVEHPMVVNALCAADAKGVGNQYLADHKCVVQPIAIAENTIGRKPENGGNGDGYTEGGPMYTLNATGVHGVVQPIAFDAYNQTTSDTVAALRCAAGGVFDNTVAQPVGAFKPGQSASAHSIGYESEMAPTLEAGGGGNNKPAVHIGMAVRRLTPTECERLQGFPDGYTDIKHNGKPTPDGPRYKALGNSMAVPVMAWIGKRIQEVEAIHAS